MKIFTTGGTIDKIYFDANSEFQVGAPAVFRVLEEANVTFDFSVESLFRKDSLELTDEDRLLIHERVTGCEETRILITHGTDTMIATAKTLLDITGKTVVLTGAMQPARIVSSDAVFNIGCAITAAQLLPSGVYVAMNGQVFDPLHSRKNRKLGRFEAS